MRAAAVGGILGPLLFTGVVIACGALRPGYSHTTQFISELGATGSPHAALMNFAGFIASGVLLTAFGASLRSLVPRRPLAGIATALVTLFGVGTVLAGIFSCDPGCSPRNPSTAAALHDGIAIVAFLSAISGVGLFSYVFARDEAWTGLAGYSALTSAAALLSLIALATSIETRALTGLWQRLMIGALYLWFIGVGVHGLRRGSHPAGARAEGAAGR